MSRALAYTQDPVELAPLVSSAQLSPVTADSSPWLFSALKNLSELARLPHNWDGYGSSPPSREALRAALQVLQAIETSEPATPHISPIPGGGVQLEWHLPGRELELEAFPDGSLEYFSVTDGQERHGSVPTFDTLSLQLLVRSLRPPPP